MGIKLKSQRSGNWIGIAMVYPSGATETVAMVLMPPDGDWRSTISNRKMPANPAGSGLYTPFIKSVFI